MISILGISITDLIYDLSFGIRLPTPKFCPHPIAILLQTCFHENYVERPGFEAIMSTLETSFREVMKKPHSVDNNCQKSDVSEITKMNNNTMQTQYTTIMSGNQQDLTTSNKLYKDKGTPEDEDTTIDPPRYVCVQNEEMPKNKT